MLIKWFIEDKSQLSLEWYAKVLIYKENCLPASGESSLNSLDMWWEKKPGICYVNRKIEEENKQGKTKRENAE